MSKPDPKKVTPEVASILRGKTPEELLADIENYIRRYVVLPAAAYLPVALWAIATYAVMLFDCYPYLALISAVKRSGKTRLAEVLEQLVRKPWRGTAPSVAALYRMLENAPTLLLDETEMFNTKNKSETTLALLAVLNAGHRKGATVPRCDGPKHEVREFEVYGPKLFAAIGRLPDTLLDRSILIHMKRRSRSQNVERFRQAKAAAEAKPMRDAAARFAQGCRKDIDQAYQRVLEADLTFLNDRDADLWTPLFAVGFLTCRKRLPELEKSARILSAAKAGDDIDDSYALTLLKDIQTVWPDGMDKYETSLLLEKLKGLEESPWLEHQLTARKLARMLKPFEVEARKIRIDERTARGYVHDQLKAAFDLYLDDLSGTCGTDQC